MEVAIDIVPTTIGSITTASASPYLMGLTPKRGTDLIAQIYLKQPTTKIYCITLKVDFTEPEAYLIRAHLRDFRIWTTVRNFRDAELNLDYEAEEASPKLAGAFLKGEGQIVQECLSVSSAFEVQDRLEKVMEGFDGLLKRVAIIEEKHPSTQAEPEPEPQPEAAPTAATTPTPPPPPDSASAVAAKRGWFR